MSTQHDKRGGWVQRWKPSRRSSLRLCFLASMASGESQFLALLGPDLRPVFRGANLSKTDVHSQIIHELDMYDFKTSWIEQKLDSECLNHIRRWLAFPQSAYVNEIAAMSRSRCGLGIQSFEHIHEKLWLKKTIFSEEQLRTRIQNNMVYNELLVHRY